MTREELRNAAPAARVAWLRKAIDIAHEFTVQRIRFARWASEVTWLVEDIYGDVSGPDGERDCEQAVAELCTFAVWLDERPFNMETALLDRLDSSLGEIERLLSEPLPPKLKPAPATSADTAEDLVSLVKRIEERDPEWAAQFRRDVAERAAGLRAGTPEGKAA